MKRVWSFLLALCVLLTACSAPESNGEDAAPGDLNEQSIAEAEAQPEPRPIGSLEELMALANERHRAVEKPRLDLEQYVAEMGESGFDIFDYVPQDWSGWSWEAEAPLSAAQAAEDLEVLFTALRSTYGPYNYFGGDEAFDAAREAILEGCRELAEAEELDRGAFAALVMEELAFVRDGHFGINWTKLHPFVVSYLYTGLAFDAAQDGRFVAREDGRVLEAVEGWENLEELLRLSLSDRGELVYYPVVLAELDQEDRDRLPEPLVLHFADGSSETLAADPWVSVYDGEEPVVGLEYIEGIPVVTCKNMGFDMAPDDEYGGRFLSYAQELLEEPVVIVDLRSNGGGNGVLPLKWLAEWTGEKVTSNSVGLMYWSEQDLLDFVSRTENSYYNSYEDFVEVGDFVPLTQEYMSVADVSDRFVPSDRLLIVLTGKNTASAAEDFVDAAMNVENVLVVGENTFGTLVSNAYTNMLLPNSEMAITLGVNLLFFPPDYFEEFVGLQPDVWTNGDALENVLHMLKAYA